MNADRSKRENDTRDERLTSARRTLAALGASLYHTAGRIDRYHTYEADVPIALLSEAAETILRTTPDRDIRREGRAYLKRWLVSEPEAAPPVYLHLFEADDPAYLHDHPYDSVSIVIAGTLYETWAPCGEDIDTERAPEGGARELGPATVAVRPAVHAHRLELAGPRRPRREAITLFTTGPHERVWGFWRNGEFLPTSASTDNDIDKLIST